MGYILQKQNRGGKRPAVFQCLNKTVFFAGRSATCPPGLEVQQFVGGVVSKLGKLLGRGEEVGHLSAS